MISNLLLPLLTLTPLTLSAPLNIRQTTTTCATGVHIIAARGSTEAAGEGDVQNLSNAIKAAIPGSTDTAVVYPATLIPYESSEEKGVTDMIQLIQQYVASCPNAQIVLTGYSQGAQIVGDTLGGGSFGDSPSAPLDEAYRSNILAAVGFGDPSRVAGKSYDYGNATNHGLFPRKNTAQLDTYSSLLASYCMDGDPVCDEGFDLDKHFAEVPTFQAQALQFVLDLAGVESGGS